MASLLGVTATSANNAWAVGFGHHRILILRWNGANWRTVRTPSVKGTLESVAATSARDAWAVGYVGTGGGAGVPPTNRPLIMHWNGHAWKRVSTHLAPGLGNLRGVTATSSGNAWAVGCNGCAAEGAGDPLIERWNGQAWGVVKAHAGREGLFAVAATSATDAWAVGVRDTIVRWNGRTWKLARSRAPAGTELLGVSALSPSHAWAVGETEVTRPFEGVILRWNGTAWN